MRFVIENPDTETVNKGKQIPYLNYGLQNNNKNAFCDDIPEYSVFAFSQHNTNNQAFWNWKPEYGIEGSFRICISAGKTQKNMCFRMNNLNTF